MSCAAIRFRTIAAVLLAALSTPVLAQPALYPSRPIMLVVGFAPGGGTDIMARLVGPKLAEELGQPVIIENRSGASGTIAAGAVARATPDGYTMLMGHVSSNAMVPAVMKVQYDPLNDFTPILLVGSVPQVVTVPANSPVLDIAGFVKLLKENPGKVNYASSGIGTQQHLAAELFKQATGTNMVHVPYRGSGQAVNDLIAGAVDVNFDTMPTVLPHIQGGTLRGLAVTTAKRAAIMPELPTIAEAGVPGYDVNTWYMVMGPKGLPQAIVDRWAAALNKALQDPNTRQRLTDLATEIGGGTPTDAAAVLRNDVEKWARVVKDAGIKATRTD